MARPKKYAHVVGSLPKLGVAPERREVIDATKAAIRAPREPGEKAPSAAFSLIEQADVLLGEVQRSLTRVAAGSPSASAYAHAYALCRAARERIDAWSSAVGVLIEAYQWLMVEAMDAEGLQSMTLASGQPISTWQEPYAKVEDREAFRRWCDADPDLRLKMALPWQTANELVKRMLLEGEASIDPETGEVKPAAMPPGLSVSALTKVRLGSE